MKIDARMSRRILMTFFGVTVCGASVSLFKMAAFGVDPFQTLMAGLDFVIPLSFGLLYVIVNALLLTFSLIFDRTRIGLGTFMNLFLCGYITQFCYGGLLAAFPSPSLPLRILFLVLGIVIMCFASAFYMTADLGVSTYDAVAIVMSGKWKMGKFKIVRICTDLVCVLLGTLIFLLGGGSWQTILASVGIGTIVTAFFMGPLIQFFNDTVAIPFLEKASGK
ncbi:MAG: hypothetical protein HUJ69_07785 [Lachnospiraceae bacterium]|nr:hypothetical protein [Lachnospiraceae bacterium]